MHGLFRRGQRFGQTRKFLDGQLAHLRIGAQPLRLVPLDPKGAEGLDLLDHRLQFCVLARQHREVGDGGTRAEPGLEELEAGNDLVELFLWDHGAGLCGSQPAAARGFMPPPVAEL